MRVGKKLLEKVEVQKVLTSFKVTVESKKCLQGKQWPNDYQSLFQLINRTSTVAFRNV